MNLSFDNPLKVFLESYNNTSTINLTVNETFDKAFSDWWDEYKIIYQRTVRTEILLSITGVSLNNNMTFTLTDETNNDFSLIIDAKKILDCEDDQFGNYLDEFKTTEKINIIHTFEDK